MLAIGAFGTAAVAMLGAALLQDMKPFYYDSGVYWALGPSFVKDGAFSLLNFDNPLRGYVLPLINYGLAEIADGFQWSPSSLVKIFNAVVFALITTVLAPKLAALAWPHQRWGFYRRLGLAALLLIFWSSYLSFPLSDFPALAAALLALIATGRPEAPGSMLVAGMASALAINMRPAYIVVIVIVIGLVALAWWTERNTPRISNKRRAVCILLLFFGFAVVSLPQALITHRHHERMSFIPGAAAGLSSLQLTEGLRLQRYETFVGTGQPGPGMRYDDPAGQQILYEHRDGTIDDIQEYLGVVVDHPVDMTGLFVRHAINGLDARYPTPYIENLNSRFQVWFRLFGFFLVFVALLRLAWPAARRSLGQTQWRYLIALLLCASPSVVSAVETRFILPVYLFTYLIVLAPGWPNPVRAIGSAGARWRTGALLFTGLALYTAIILYVITNASDQLRVV